MKILFITDRFYPLIGGGENYVLNLATRLVDKGHEVYVFTSIISDSSQREVKNGVKIFRFPSTLRICGQPIIQYIRKILQNNIDIIHASGPSLNEDLFLPSLRVFNNPTVVTYHADFVMRNPLIKLYYLLKASMILGFADRVIVTSGKYAKALRRRGLSKRKIRVIPLGVDESVFKPATEEEKVSLKKRHNLAGDIILFIGALSREHRYKHPELLLKVFKSLLNKRGKLKLIIVGGGERREYYKVWSKKLGLERNVLFTGQLSDGVLADLYKIADVFVLPSPSPSEGFGTVLLEAMSSACPVVCTSACGGSEIVQKEKAGVVAKPWDTNDLELAIDKLLSDKKLAEKLGRNGRTAVEVTYSLDKVVERTEQLYTEISR